MKSSRRTFDSCSSFCDPLYAGITNDRRLVMIAYNREDGTFSSVFRCNYQDVQDCRMPNRLKDAPSPYLQQHADNPVDWYSWGAEALAAAAESDKPIFLSIGYSACHWCHVMEHESFRDPEIADYLNQHYISIKVDREERPDLDQIYMVGVMAVNGGQGGWPLSAFLTPDQKFFYGGTYWPPRSRRGMPGFLDVLRRVQQVYSTQRTQVTEQAQQMNQFIAARLVGRDQVAPDSPVTTESTGATPDSDSQLVTDAVQQLIDACDWQWGGFGDAPKFPHVMDMQLLLQVERRMEQSRRRKNADDGHYQAETLRQACQVALDRMAAGGIYDHIGGGFARYSVDAQWLVPHFEKMLYDNALLLQAYAEGYLRLHEENYRDVIRQTAAYLSREMQHPAGGFYSSQDADSEGVEGKYYLWTPEEVKAQLPGDLGTRFCTAFDITMDGNFEGRSIPNRRKSIGVPLKEMGLSEEELENAKATLLEVRSQRIAPATDTKILTSWNGLTIEGLTRAGMAIGDPQLVQQALQAASFARKHLTREDGRLWHAWRDLRAQWDGEVPGDGGYLNAYLDDYAAMANAALALYDATWDEVWLNWARQLVDRMIHDFADPDGGFFFTSADHESLPARGKDLHDNSLPGANSLAARCLWKIQRLWSSEAYAQALAECCQDGRRLAKRTAGAAAHVLATLDRQLGPNREWVLLLPEAEISETWRARLWRQYRPYDLFLVRTAHPASNRMAELDLHFQGRQCMDAQPTLYLCENRICKAPVIGEAAIERLLLQG